VVPVAVVLRLRVELVEKVMVHHKVVPEVLEQAVAAEVQVSSQLWVVMVVQVSLSSKLIKHLEFLHQVVLADISYHKLFYIK
jgi:hypothetical protein